MLWTIEHKLQFTSKSLRTSDPVKNAGVLKQFISAGRIHRVKCCVILTAMTAGLLGAPSTWASFAACSTVLEIN